jgi:hypothetical protein
MSRSLNGGSTTPHARYNFEIMARRFLVALPMGLHASTVGDVRDALAIVSHGRRDATARQYVLRFKSLLGYAHKLGYTQFKPAPRSRFAPIPATVALRSPSGSSAPPRSGC